MKFLLPVLMLTLPLTAFANILDTLCDIGGYDISFDIGSKTPQDAGSRTFYALEIGKKGQVDEDEKGVHQILNTSPKHEIDFMEHNGDFSLVITSKAKHKLIFSAKKTTAADGSLTTSVFSNIEGFTFPQTTFTCH
jgi:hypothetical protein